MVLHVVRMDFLFSVFHFWLSRVLFYATVKALSAFILRSTSFNVKIVTKLQVATLFTTAGYRIFKLTEFLTTQHRWNR